MRTTELTAAAVVALLITISPAVAWHGEGHERITRVALRAVGEEVPAFLAAGKVSVAHCSVDPDLFTRPIGPDTLHATEAPEHYLDWELVGLDRLPPTRYALVKHIIRRELEPAKVGFVPYAVTEWTQRLTVALAEHGRYPDNPHIRRKCLVYAGILSHYAADLCMPLHTTIHYDGRVGENGESPRSGIHLKTDRLVQKLRVDEKEVAAGLDVRRFEKILPAVEKAFMASHALVDRVYEVEESIPGYDAPLDQDSPAGKLARQRLDAAAELVASLYATAWEKSAGIDLPDWYHRPESEPDRAAPQEEAPARNEYGKAGAAVE